MYMVLNNILTYQKNFKITINIFKEYTNIYNKPFLNILLKVIKRFHYCVYTDKHSSYLLKIEIHM